MNPEVQLAVIVNQLREATQKAIASLEGEIAVLKRIVGHQSETIKENTVGLVKVAKEQAAEIAALKMQNAELASRIRELEQWRAETTPEEEDHA